MGDALPHLLPLLALAAWALCAAASGAWGAETVIVNKAFDGREIKLRVGAAVRVELEQPGATGYTWELKNLDAEHFELMGVETAATPSPGLSGAPVMKAWTIRAKQPGMSELRFNLGRPWEGDKPAAETFWLKIRVL